MQRVYDQTAIPVARVGVEQAARLGNTLQVNFLSALAPGTSTISETQDVTPQTFAEATATISPTSRGEAIQFSQELTLDVFTDFTAAAYEAVGQNQMESVEVLAIASALAGTNCLRAAARASLDAGTAGNRLTDSAMSEASTLLQTLKCPGYERIDGAGVAWFAIMRPEPYHDLRVGGNIVSIAQYQQAAIILANELGSVGNFRLIVSPWAKVFGGAGTDNASPLGTTGTTLSSAAARLATQIVVADETNVSSGDWLTIGTEETGNTFYPTNERVRVSTAYVSGTTIDIIGEGPNGGLRYAHASGAAVNNNDSVFPVLYAGPQSLAKVYDSGTGEFGMTVGPKTSGLLDQFNSLGWKFYGGYGRWVESWLLRGEYSTSLEA